MSRIPERNPDNAAMWRIVDAAGGIGRLGTLEPDRQRAFTQALAESAFSGHHFDQRETDFFLACESQLKAPLLPTPDKETQALSAVIDQAGGIDAIGKRTEESDAIDLASALVETATADGELRNKELAVLGAIAKALPSELAKHLLFEQVHRFQFDQEATARRQRKEALDQLVDGTLAKITAAVAVNALSIELTKQGKSGENYLFIDKDGAGALGKYADLKTQSEIYDKRLEMIIAETDDAIARGLCDKRAAELREALDALPTRVVSKPGAPPDGRSVEYGSVIAKDDENHVSKLRVELKFPFESKKRLEQIQGRMQQLAALASQPPPVEPSYKP